MSLSEVKRTFEYMQETDFEMIDSIICNTTLSIETKCEGNLSLFDLTVVITLVS